MSVKCYSVLFDLGAIITLLHAFQSRNFIKNICQKDDKYDFQSCDILSERRSSGHRSRQMNNDLWDIKVSEDSPQLGRAFNTCIPLPQTTKLSPQQWQDTRQDIIRGL